MITAKILSRQKTEQNINYICELISSGRLDSIKSIKVNFFIYKVSVQKL